jgi:hypothetical protein
MSKMFTKALITVEQRHETEAFDIAINRFISGRD